MIYWIIGGIVILALVIYVLYRIGLKVKKQEAFMQEHTKKQFVKGQKAKKNRRYANASTPKVPTLKK